jgi:putative two-component system hydrogenase maturation factor HypX/HoxX
LLNACLPISINEAKNIGLVDEIFDFENYRQNLENFCKELIEDEDSFDEFIWKKQNYLEENYEFIDKCKEQEIKTMYPEFWDKNSIFHKLRYEFVYKICPTQTPSRLKEKNA